MTVERSQFLILGSCAKLESAELLTTIIQFKRMRHEAHLLNKSCYLFIHRVVLDCIALSDTIVDQK